MLEFIAQYWLTFVFGIIAAGVSFLARRFWSLYKSEKQHQKTEEQKAFYDGLMNAIADGYSKSKDDDAKLQAQIDDQKQELNALKTGLLSVQGRDFRRECYKLLDPDKKISVEDYEQFEEDYAAYKALGGNHRGDTLHTSVVEKFNKQISE